jgi:RecB family exonuclease
MERERDRAEDLAGVVNHLTSVLEPLRRPQPAHDFIEAFKAVVKEYFDERADAYPDVLNEIEQLGTIAAVSGDISLASFSEALRANLQTATLRPQKLGDGIVLAGYTQAAGMRFKRVFLCGAYEGALPAGPGESALIDDSAWQALRVQFASVEDVATRLARSAEAASRAELSAGSGTVLWSSPAFEPGGTREYYPSSFMAEAISKRDGSTIFASDLRNGNTGARRQASPFASILRGPVLGTSEMDVRRAVLNRRDGLALPQSTSRSRAIAMIEARRGARFTEWEGNVAIPATLPSAPMSPTRLEEYAGCGFRYFCARVLRLGVVSEPELLETMDAAARGTLIHGVLEEFFREQQLQGRPAVGEAWNEQDRQQLLAILERWLHDARDQGQTGLEIYAGHDRRSMRADLERFLEEDTLFRQETGCVPDEFEALVESDVAGIPLRGKADRIDRSPDRRTAWVIDYKTGRPEKISDKDPLAGGTKLQLPVYLAAAADSEKATAIYWFISNRGKFERAEYIGTPRLEQRFRDTVTAIAGGIAAGVYPAVSGGEDEFFGGFTNCRFCNFNRVCSLRREEAHAEKSADTPMEPWLSIALAAAG